MCQGTSGRVTGQESAGAVVPAIAAPSSVACIRSLYRRGIRTIAVSSNPTAAAFRSRYCDETVAVPSPYEDLVAYKDALLTLVARQDVAAIIPVREADVYVLAKYRSAFADHVVTPWPSMDRLKRVQDRVLLFDAADMACVSTPETRILGEVDWADRDRIVKARYSILTDTYLDTYPPERCVTPPSTIYLPAGERTNEMTLRTNMDHEPIVQEYLPTTDEYGFFALYDEGDPITTFQHRQVRGWNYSGGPSAYRESVDIPALETAGRALLDGLEWHGLAMVEFLRDEDSGEFKLMEVNPRFWSSLPFTVRTGANFPYYFWLLACGESDDITDDYEVGLTGHLLRGELSYLHSVIVDDEILVDRPPLSTALREVLVSLYRDPRFDYLQIDDPLPFVQDLWNTMRGIDPRW